MVLESTFKEVSVKAMKTFFSAQQGITSAEFLARVRYTLDFPSSLKTYFQEAVSRFSPVETYRLHRFITDEKYIASIVCHIHFSPQKYAVSLPVVSTCSKHLYIPPYPDADILH